MSTFDFGAAGVERSEPPVRKRWGLVSLDPSHPTPIPRLDKALGPHVDGPPPLEAWMSWVDPKTVESDFHVPTSLGMLAPDGSSSGAHLGLAGGLTRRRCGTRMAPHLDRPARKMPLWQGIWPEIDTFTPTPRPVPHPTGL